MSIIDNLKKLPKELIDIIIDYAMPEYEEYKVAAIDYYVWVEPLEESGYGEYDDRVVGDNISLQIQYEQDWKEALDYPFSDWCIDSDDSDYELFCD